MSNKSHSNLKNLTDKLVNNYLRFKEGALVLFYEDSQIDIAKSIVDSAIKQYNGKTHEITTINVDSYRRKVGGLITEFPKDLEEQLKLVLKKENFETNVTLYISGSKEGEKGLYKGLKEICQSAGKFGGLPRCTVDVLEAGFNPENIPEFVEELYDFLQNEKEIIVENDIGTKLIIDIDTNKYNWVKSDGILLPGKYANPLPAEVYTYPANVNGKYVINGSLGHLLSVDKYREDFSRLAKDLEKTPITWNIKDGKIYEILCNDDYILEKSIKNAFETDTDHGMKIGEIGIPANLFVLNRGLTGHLLIDEKGRVHLAHGDGYQIRTNCDYVSTSVHNDGLADKASLYSTRLGKYFMKDNVFNPDIFKTLKK